MDKDIQKYSDIVAAYATEAGIKVLAAIAFWIIGRWLIGLAGRMLQRVLEKQKVDPTLMRYIGSFLAVTLNIVLVVAILGYFGVQTTTFAALVAGIGIAIGAAWGGLLSNFAAGAFLIVLKPFKVGDFISAGGLPVRSRKSACLPPRSTRRTTCFPSSATARSSATPSRISAPIRFAASN